MKGKILELLKTKFVGVDEKILERISEKLSEKTTSEEEAKKAVDGVTYQTIIQSEADRRATEATKSAIENYEKKHGLKDGKKVDPEPQPKPESKPDPKPQPNGDDMPEWAKAMLENQNKQIEILTSKLDNMDKEKVANSRKALFAESIKALPDKQKAMYEKNFQRMSFESDDDFNAFMDDHKKDIEEVIKENIAKGAVFGFPIGSAGASGGGEVSDILKGMAEKSEAERKNQKSLFEN